MRKRKSPSALRKSLRVWRKTGGRTLQELAPRLNVSTSQLCEFERGVGDLQPQKIRKLERILRQSLRARARRISRLLSAEQPVRKPFRGQPLIDRQPDVEKPALTAGNAEGGQQNL